MGYGEQHPVPWHTTVSAHGYLGVALTASGDPGTGIGYLRKATMGGRASVLLTPIFDYWFHRAATELDLEHEAQTVSRRAAHYLAAAHSDLSDAQWNQALATGHISRLASIARPIDGTGSGSV